MSDIPNTGSRNVLNADVEINGNLKFSGELTFAGRLDGEIQSEGALHLGDQAVVRGNINLHSVVLWGKVSGNVSAKEKLEIKSRGQLFGDVRASKLVIEEGATFVGKCDVNPNKAFPAPLPGAAGATRPPEPFIPIKK
ncbi:MAG TPA: polymer-forming cytoskeletal protein [Candidatus Saccharimonadales bacterium]|jgi:cytoskeletal protein CcmA (bactofilin family)|nr:polymer-forming cytoskeletal protein [Candidatus Saccharimonadales bacterium]